MLEVTAKVWGIMYERANAAGVRYRTQLVRRLEAPVNDSDARVVCSMSTFHSASTVKAAASVITRWSCVRCRRSTRRQQ